MVDRYRIWPKGFAAHMRPAKAVDMVFAEEYDTRIAELEAENVKLRKALELIAEGRPVNPVGDPWAFYDDLVSVARRALGGKKDG